VRVGGCVRVCACACGSDSVGVSVMCDVWVDVLDI
jgi:hypothetical protein